MAITAHETREEKLTWLTRPFRWASDFGLMLCLSGASAWYYPDTLSPSHLSLLLLTGIGVIMGLLMWGIIRISNAARGRI